MRSRPVTVDSIDITAHQRYASDQANLDPQLKNPTLLAHHSEIAATTTNFASKHEELLGIKTSTSWAMFSAPPKSWRSKRFFFFRLSEKLVFQSARKLENAEPNLVSLYSNTKEFQVDNNQEIVGKIQLTISSLPEKFRTAMENEKQTLINMVLCINHLNQLISEIHAKKNQHQKG